MISLDDIGSVQIGSGWVWPGGGGWDQFVWGRIGSNRVALDWIGRSLKSDWVGSDQIGPDRTGSGLVGSDSNGSILGPTRVGSDRVVLGWIGSDQIRSDRI